MNRRVSYDTLLGTGPTDRNVALVILGTFVNAGCVVIKVQVCFPGITIWFLNRSNVDDALNALLAADASDTAACGDELAFPEFSLTDGPDGGCKLVLSVRVRH